MTYRKLIEYCSNSGVGCENCESDKVCDRFIGVFGNVPSSYNVPSYCKKVVVELDLDKEIVNEEIIRCEDCTYFDDNYCFCVDDGCCQWHDSFVNKSDYCSKAERKDEE